jgi:hypothetical protein
MPKALSSEYSSSIESISDLTIHAIVMIPFIVWSVVILYKEERKLNDGKFPFKLFYKDAHYWIALVLSIFLSNTIIGSMYRLFDVSLFLDLNIVQEVFGLIAISYVFCWILLAVRHVYFSVTLR